VEDVFLAVKRELIKFAFPFTKKRIEIWTEDIDFEVLVIISGLNEKPCKGLLDQISKVQHAESSQTEDTVGPYSTLRPPKHGYENIAVKSYS
jgi:hypothetical protein